MQESDCQGYQQQLYLCKEKSPLIIFSQLAGRVYPLRLLPETQRRITHPQKEHVSGAKTQQGTDHRMTT